MKTARLPGRLLVITLLLALFSSCAHLVHLDRAQNTFNRGAEMENRIRFSADNRTPISPTLLYNQAYAEVQKSLKQEGKLKSENVLGNAYCIKALCEWKLKNYAEAEKSAVKALDIFLDMEEKSHIEMARDKVIMETLPIMINIEKTWSEVQTYYQPDNNTFSTGKSHFLTHVYNPSAAEQGNLEKYLSELEEKRLEQQHNEELHNYLLLSQLAGLKNWSNALDYLRSCITEDIALQGRDREEATQFLFQQKEEDFKKQKDRLLAELAKILPDGEQHPMYKFWNRIM
ncbi:MAG TPA: hypothetical protein PKA00_15120 [Saprospiraceae bacterium]|nr:hypothetical protein [Saprospiraceae bacterium]HMQ84243.1 hypothetical protein [Saprospiraceae bacterium]